MVQGFTIPLTVELAPGSDPTGRGMVFQPRAMVEGQTAPGAIIRVSCGPMARNARADASGHYQVPIRVGMGVTPMSVRATSRGGGSGTATMPVMRGNMVIAWNAVALEAIRADATPPPDAARELAIVEASVYDAVNAIVPTGSVYHVAMVAPRGASPDAAAVGAAYEALVKLDPAESAMFRAALGASLAGLGRGASTARGLAFGEAVADRMLAWRANDGSAARVDYTPGTAAGQWRPTPTKYAPALNPQWPGVAPFALASGSQFRPPAPPALDSAQYAAAVAQLRSLGGAQSTARTADQTQIALFWNDGSGTATPPGHWNEIAEMLALQHRDSLVKDARVFALLDIAEADAAIACWDAKFAYNLWRPVTVIRSGDTAANPALTADPGWTPLIATPPFPSYVSGHSTFSGAAATVLASIYGPNTPITIGSDSLPGVTRSFPSLQAAAQEAGMSRIYGGIHYAFDNQQGLALGQAVGQYVVGHELLPVRIPKEHRG